MYIIAEIGINHGGELGLAHELILGASQAGADAIKFQYRNLDRSYSKDANELGDDIVQSEIRKNYLKPYDIEKLVEYAKTLGLEVGISFFTVDDVLDFSNYELFDFFKIPSVEFQNMDLITKLLNLNKPVHASLGCQSESSIEKIMAHFQTFENFHTMHCVSNYPVIAHNSNLGYIRYFKDKYQREIGYSSHEEDWQLVLAAVALGANTIERHISLGNRAGLDETSSTNINEFSEMVRLVKLVESAKNGYAPRHLNQGELLNRQNLGRSYYSKRSYKQGEIIAKDDLVYLAPAKGLMVHEIDQYLTMPVVQNVSKGEVIRSSHFLNIDKCQSEEREFCRSHKIALPVRLHDFEVIKKEFDIGCYEFHLSYKEVEDGLEGVPVSKDEQYSIHLPDYISPLDLMDPFGSDEIASKSKAILDKIYDFASQIQDRTGIQCPVVGSFSVNNSESKTEFYENIANLCKYYSDRSVSLLPQWLPPVAWYFGGSIPLNVFNSGSDIELIKRLNINICFDSSHFLMCLNAGKVDCENNLEDLLKISSHCHVSGADGIDGEGTPFVNLDESSEKVISRCINLNCLKVIETWQGHLDGFAGFHTSIKSLRHL